MISMATNLLSYVKDAAVNANLLQPVYGMIQIPHLTTVCKPIMKAVVDCAWWSLGMWCNTSEVATGDQRCFSRQTVEEKLAVVGYEMDPTTLAVSVAAAAVTTVAAVATFGCLYKRCTDKKVNQAEKSNDRTSADEIADEVPGAKKSLSMQLI